MIKDTLNKEIDNKFKLFHRGEKLHKAVLKRELKRRLAGFADDDIEKGFFQMVNSIHFKLNIFIPYIHKTIVLVYNSYINIEKHTNLQPSNCSPTREIVCYLKKLRNRVFVFLFRQ